MRVVEDGDFLSEPLLRVCRILGMEAMGGSADDCMPGWGLVPLLSEREGLALYPPAGQGRLMVLLATFQLVFTK